MHYDIFNEIVIAIAINNNIDQLFIRKYWWSGSLSIWSKLKFMGGPKLLYFTFSIKISNIVLKYALSIMRFSLKVKVCAVCSLDNHSIHFGDSKKRASKLNANNSVNNMLLSSGFKKWSGSLHRLHSDLFFHTFLSNVYIWTNTQTLGENRISALGFDRDNQKCNTFNPLHHPYCLSPSTVLPLQMVVILLN